MWMLSQCSNSLHDVTSSDCGRAGSIWMTNMGDFGACAVCGARVPMSSGDEEMWVCNRSDISLNPFRSWWNSKTCSSWSTKHSCEFRQRDLKSIQFSFESSGCGGLWVAPLWLAPERWTHPQYKTGEIDVLERGCSKWDGYIMSFGSSPEYILKDAWKERGNPSANTKFAAYVSFDRDRDEVSVYRCPHGSYPISDGLDSCQQTAVHAGYFRDTSARMRDGNALLHLVSDVWNQCGMLACGKSQVGWSNCHFEISNLKIGFVDDATRQGRMSPFEYGNPQCDAIWHRTTSN